MGWDTLCVFVAGRLILSEGERMEKEEYIYELLSKGEIQRVKEEVSGVTKGSGKLIIIEKMIEVYEAQRQAGEKETIFDTSLDAGVLEEYYKRVKLLFRRVDFDMPTFYQKEFFDYCMENHVSVYLLAEIILNNAFHKEECCKKLMRFYIEEKGEQSGEVRYLAVLLGELQKSNRGKNKSTPGGQEGKYES